MKNKVKSFIKGEKFVAAAGVIMLGWAAGAPTVQAADDGNAPSMHVSYADLNLQSDVGVKVLYARIRSAANQVCEPLRGADLVRRSHFDACVSHAVTTSVAAMNNARVTAMHNESGKPYRKS